MKKLYGIVVIILSLFVLQSCHGQRQPLRTSRVTITVGGKSVAMVKAGSAKSLKSPASSALPTDVYTIQVIVSAEDMTPITASVPVAGLPNVTITLDVPNGMNRIFVVEGLDINDLPLYVGSATADLTGAPVSLAINLIHLTLPAILSTSPASDVVNVAINAVVSATFNWPMDTTTITPATFLLTDNVGNPVSGTVLASGSTATFIPAANLLYAAPYTATITTGVKDLIGLSLASNYTWTFTTATDNIPPTFGGITLVTSPTLTSIQLSWSAASDNVTPPSGIVYLIYEATSPGGENFVSPTYTTAPGATSYLVTGLTPGAIYYYVVRARDAAGNNDGNSIEGSGYYLGKYVNIATGLDQAGCGAPDKPCQTITFALSQSSGNENILVAPGIYSSTTSSTAPYETLPLVLKTGTLLICYGSNYSTVIDDTDGLGTVAIIMNDGNGLGGTLIEGCRVNASTYGPAIDDSGLPMTINDSLVTGISGTSFNFPTTGIQVSGNSAVMNSTLAGFPGSDGNGAGIVVSSDALISGNTISGNYVGVYVSTGSPLISANTFTGNSNGVNVADGTPTIDNNTITYDSSYGIYSYSTATSLNPIVSNNVISNGYGGIFMYGGNWDISSNTISNNIGIGIQFYGLGINIGGSVAGNTITANDTGIDISGSAITFPPINNNSLSCNISADLNSNATTTVDATGNVWDYNPPSIASPSVAPCPPGTDICYQGTLPDYSSYTQVSSPCP